MKNDDSTLSQYLLSGRQRPVLPSPSSLGDLLLDKVNLPSIPPPPNLAAAAQRYLNPSPLMPTIIPLLRTTPTTESGLIKRVREDAARIVKRQFRVTRARKIPTVSDVAFDEARLIQTSVLHIDIRSSSGILNQCGHINTLKIYKIFHTAMVIIARFKGGQIRTFAGDRIGVFFDIDKVQRTKAVETALLMQAVIDNTINPLISQQFGYSLRVGIGVDFGEMLVGRIGIYGNPNNDLVWTGNAANYASKLADYNNSGVFISNEVHINMAKSLKEDVGMMWQVVNDANLGTFHRFIGIRTFS